MTVRRAKAPLEMSARLGQWAKLGHIKIRDPFVDLGYKDFNPVAVDAGTVALSHSVRVKGT